MQHQNIWAVGRNYAEHAKELGNEVPSTPLFFLKSGSCLQFNSTIELPNWVTEVHHEIEIALLIDENSQFSHYTLALDLTERNLQNDLKKKGQPWTLAKSFINACPIGQWQIFKNWEELKDKKLSLSVNGSERQAGYGQQMIFAPIELLAYVREHFPVQPGDILLTGTPAGVGPIHRGDILVGQIKDLIETQWKIF